MRWDCSTVIAMMFYIAFSRPTQRAAKGLAFSPHSLFKQRHSRSFLFHTSVYQKEQSTVASVLAAKPMRREDYYSINDAFDDETKQRRPFPPSMSSQDEEEGFGAYDYDAPIAADDRPKVRPGSRPYPRSSGDGATGPNRSPPLEMKVVISSKPLEEPSFDDAIVEESVTLESPDMEFGQPPIGPDPGIGGFRPSYGSGSSVNLVDMEGELASIEDSIYEQNKGSKFNVNAPKQVAAILYGKSGGSTNKDVLEGMAAGGNRLAELVLKYRALKYQIGKLVRRQESVAKGTAVLSASTVARAATNASIEGVDIDDVPLSDVSTDPLLLLDASAYIFRAYYSMPPIHRSDGMPTGAVMGFCKMLNSMLLDRMLQGEQPRLVLVFDAKGKTFRHDLYSAYKGNRPSAPMDLVPQFDLVRQAAKAYGICQIQALSFEADDVIATLATVAVQEGVDANILSGDKDLMQLVTELNATPSIQMIDPVKKDRTTYKQVLEKWEVPPSKLGDVLALSGDTADNIPGVKGIGPKNAAKLINEFDSLENLLNNIDSVKQQGLRDKLNEDKHKARLSRVLVELNRTVPFEMITGFPDGTSQRISDLRMEPMDAGRILAFYDQMGFKELKRTFEYRLKGVKSKRKSSSYGKAKSTVPQPHNYSDVPF
jgi:5'-3' exonuclease